jgi:hypothetical protein
MAGENTPIINIITSKLRGELSIPIYNEFSWRFREVQQLLDNYEYYKPLKQYEDIVEFLLALSIFHNHVIANLDGAEKFYGKVTRQQQAEAISIGKYKLDAEEVRKIRSTIIAYDKLLMRYGLGRHISNYQRTTEFLSKLINLKKYDDDRATLPGRHQGQGKANPHDWLCHDCGDDPDGARFWLGR